MPPSPMSAERRSRLRACPVGCVLNRRTCEMAAAPTNPSEVSSSRISLDFGLRSADFFFRDLVVPELGRIWFVRQLSWPLASLALHEAIQSHGSNAPKPTAICHGIEALACKLEYKVDPQGPFERILGSRAFGHDDDGSYEP